MNVASLAPTTESCIWTICASKWADSAVRIRCVCHVVPLCWIALALIICCVQCEWWQAICANSSIISSSWTIHGNSSTRSFACQVKPFIAGTSTSNRIVKSEISQTRTTVCCIAHTCCTISCTFIADISSVVNSASWASCYVDTSISNLVPELCIR